MEKRGTDLSRRSLIKGMGALGTFGVMGALAGCSPSVSKEESGGTATSSDALPFDEETEVVVVGTGTGIFGALAAHHEGRKVIALEKGSTYGGTTVLSDRGFWVPGNHLRDTAKHSADEPSTVVEYMKGVDIYGTMVDEVCLDFATHAGRAHEYINEELGVPLKNFDRKDYYRFPGCGFGRTIGIPDWDELRSVVDASGLDIRLKTEATELIVDSAGAVVGVVAQSGGKTTRIKATKGVVLAAGGFDHEEDMRKTYLRTPMRGTVAVATNTGDGHRMAMKLGADTANMPSMYYVMFYTEDNADVVTDPMAIDIFHSRMFPGNIIVNSKGKRVCDETASYDAMGLALGNINAQGSDPLLNNPVFICDARHVSDYGFPGRAETKPEWVHEYQTLEELADGQGIDKDMLLEEVARFNSFCDTGIDRDFHRGESGFADLGTGPEGGSGPGGARFLAAGVTREDLANPYLAKLETPPFYAATVGCGSFGTSGGLAVNENAQVLKEGEPIGGLYAAGCTAAALTSGYMGGGTSIATGAYRSVKAVDHALELNLF